MQILARLSKQPCDDITKALGDPESEASQTYRLLEMVFEDLKAMYTRDGPLISAKEAGIADASDCKTIYLVNLATISMSFFEFEEVRLSAIHDNFLEAFLAEDAELSSDLEEIFLGLKTQLFLSSLKEAGRQKSGGQLLDEIFLGDLEDRLRERRSSAELTARDQDFLASSQARKEALLGESVPSAGWYIDVRGAKTVANCSSRPAGAEISLQ
jgi:hypothetical protein